MRPRIPEELSEKIEMVVDNTSYRSKTEFVIDSVRRRLEEIE